MRKIKFEVSPRKNKKYRVHFMLDGVETYVDFGHTAYEQYKDRTPLKYYSYLDHMDKERRRLYLARASRIVNGKGELTAKDPLSANYWSINYLW